jgi:hypothetical protein
VHRTMLRAMSFLAGLHAVTAWELWARTPPGEIPWFRPCGAEGRDGPLCAAKAPPPPSTSILEALMSREDWSASWEGGPTSIFSTPSPPQPLGGERLTWTTRAWWRSNYYEAFKGLARESLSYCDTWYTRLHLLARWAKWCVVVCAVILLGYSTKWTIVWVILPLWGLGAALFLYLRGDSSWAAVREAQGAVPTQIAWVGPKGQEPWTGEYVKKFVRGRGEQRCPLDLIVSDDVSMARLRHGIIRGRADRRGFRMNSQGSHVQVHDCTHRCFRNRLERLEVHLCAHHPCTLPDPGGQFVHVSASATLDQGKLLDLSEIEHHGPWRRCFMVSWFLGLLSFNLGMCLVQLVGGCLRRARGCGCSRRAPRPGRHTPQDPE